MTNKVERNDANAKANIEADKIAEAGNSLLLQGGEAATVELQTGPVQVFGRWNSSDSGPCVVMLGQAGAKGFGPLQGLADAVAAQGCQVIVPILSGSGAHKELDANVAELTELLDWLGVAQPVLYGRDWGAIIACKFKICHPRRVGGMVFEEFDSKIDEKEYKARCKKDPSASFSSFNSAFQWLSDGGIGNCSMADVKPGANLKGMKGKVTFLWPMCSKGRHDPKGRISPWTLRMGELYARLLKSKPIDSYLLKDNDVATLIVDSLKRNQAKKV